MCGHGTIGVATVLVETGMVEVTEPETEVALDTPAGLVRVRVAVEDGRATAVTLRNVPSFLLARDREIDGVPYDMAYGGNFYALVEASAAGIAVDPARSDELIARGLGIMAAINRADAPVHPEDPRISGCRHVVFYEDAPGGARNATAIEPGWLDRSPCGTGTSARMAQLHARGELALGEDFVNESVIGTRFTGRLIEETTVGGLPAVVPEITGRAWVTGHGPVPARPERSVPRRLRPVSSPDVVVLGAGIVGACAALELARDGATRRGHRARRRLGRGLLLGQRRPAGPSHARPIAAPSRSAPGSAGWSTGLAVRPQAQALARAVAGALPPRLDRAARGGRRGAPARALRREPRHLPGARRRGDRRRLRRDGLPDGAHLGRAEEHAAAEAASETGRALGARVLSGDEARELEPSLTARVRAAVLFPDEARCDPVRLAAAVGAAAVGARRPAAHGRRGVRGRRGRRRETTHGPVRAGTVVVAAGAWSGRLARTAGVRLPLQGGKGYAAEWDPAAAPVRMPLYLHDQRVVANPMGDRTRITGGLLLDGLDESFDHRRVRAIAAAAEEVLGVRARPRLTWRGLRPCTPDGLPVIGAHERPRT